VTERCSKRKLKESKRRLNGVPFFVINGVSAFSGALNPETFVAAFRRVLV
jgi:predicted DsbA family dithiol-disulfide isomerase